MRFVVLAGVALVATLGITLLTSQTWERLDSLRTELAALKAQNAKLRTENRHFAREAALLQRDPLALEQVARREYGLIRSDERIILLGKSK